MRFLFVTSALTAAALAGCGADPSGDPAREEGDYDPISLDGEPDYGDRSAGQASTMAAGDRGINGPNRPFNRAPRSVYVLNSSTLGNELIELRPADGDLVIAGAYDTGGVSLPKPERLPNTAGSLGVQPLITQGLLAQSGPYLFVANSGSSSITTFRRTNDGSLARTDVDVIDGPPISLVARGDRVFAAVLPGPDNPGGVIALDLSEDGDLEPSGPLLGLSGPGAQPSQVLLGDQDRYLVVPEHLTGQINVWPLDESGAPGARVTSPAAGGPFSAAAFGPGYLLVAESLPLEGPASTISTYRFERDGFLAPVTSSLAAGQVGASWIAISPDQSRAYVANVESRSLSSFELGADGSAIVDLPVAARLDERILDLGLDATGRFLQVLLGESDGVLTFELVPGGRLAPVSQLTDLGLAPGGSHELLPWRARGAIQPGLAPDDPAGSR